jgi:predicted NACHT family NTPase
VTQIREFCRTYHKNSIIVTCRTNALDYNFLDLGFTEVIVADFEQKQIEMFAHKWFVAFAKNDPEAGQARAKHFVERLHQPKNKRIRDLAITPILLNLTCLVFQDLGDFPSSRAKLYQQGLNILLKEWDSSKGVQREQLYGNLSVKEKEALLTHVAAMTFTQNRYFFEQGEIEGHIVDYLRTLPHAQTDRLQQDSETVLKAIEVQHGLLVERSREIYSFSHLTFHEYFTAKFFFEISGSKTARKFVCYLTELRYKEVSLLFTELHCNASSLLSFKKNIDNILGLDEQLQKFLFWLYDKSLSLQSSYKRFSIRLLYLFLYLDKCGFCYNFSCNYFSEYRVALSDEIFVILNLDENLINAFNLARLPVQLTELNFIDYNWHFNEKQKKIAEAIL